MRSMIIDIGGETRMTPVYRMMQVRESSEDPWTEMFVLHINLDGSCVTAYVRQGSTVATSIWKFCREIPAPKTRLMTRDELVLFVCTTPNIAVRLKKSDWKHPARFAFGYDSGLLDDYEWCECTKDGFGKPRRFEVEEKPERARPLTM